MHGELALRRLFRYDIVLTKVGYSLATIFSHAGLWAEGPVLYILMFDSSTTSYTYNPMLLVHNDYNNIIFIITNDKIAVPVDLDLATCGKGNSNHPNTKSEDDGISPHASTCPLMLHEHRS